MSKREKKKSKALDIRERLAPWKNANAHVSETVAKAMSSSGLNMSDGVPDEDDVLAMIPPPPDWVVELAKEAAGKNPREK